MIADRSADAVGTEFERADRWSAGLDRGGHQVDSDGQIPGDAFPFEDAGAWLDPTDPASRDACSVLAEGKVAKDVPVAYVCRGRTCSLPVSTPDELAPLLEVS